MSDIALAWNADLGCADWTLVSGDVQTGSDLETAVIISLFTDAVASPDYVPSDGNPRGWWATSEPRGFSVGSNLWELDRAKKTNETLLKAKNFAATALQWLIDDGVADTITVAAEWQGSTNTPVLALAIVIIEPDGTVSTFKYGWAWGTIN